MLGILVVDKPLGITSHDVVSRVRRKFQLKRVGHAGTLDPLATGVLIVAVGPATRFLQYLNLEPKVYEFTVRFGQATTTQDAEGEIVAENEVPDDLQVAISGAIPRFLGEIQQLPPIYSAIKRDGKPLYQYAREGIEVERTLRTIFVESLELLQCRANEADFRCVCSGGTYVRTIAHDLGEAIGCGGHIKALRRTGVGRFNLDQAVELDNALPEHLVPLAEALKPLQSVTLPDEIEDRIRQGQRVAIRPVPTGLFVALTDSQNEVVGIARVVNGSLHPECVIPKSIHDNG